MDRTGVASKADLRQFGIVVGGIFLVTGLWPLILRGGPPNGWALIPGGVLVFAALLVPRLLGPVHRAWMSLGLLLGWINTRVVLGIVFFGVITPLGMAMRFFGRDPLRLRTGGDVATYRVARSLREKTHMRNQF